MVSLVVDVGNTAANGYMVSFWDDEILWKYLVVLVVQYCDYTENNYILHFGMVKFMACELYLCKK